MECAAKVQVSVQHEYTSSSSQKPTVRCKEAISSLSAYQSDSSDQSESEECAECSSEKRDRDSSVFDFSGNSDSDEAISSLSAYQSDYSDQSESEEYAEYSSENKRLRQQCT